MCETNDLGIKRTQCGTLQFDGYVAVETREGLPAGRENDASEAGQDGVLDELGRHSASLCGV